VVIGIIRLDRNEIPYPPPERVIEASKKGLLDVNRYPDPEEADQLRRMLASYSNVEQRCLFLGSGSDSLIVQVLRLFSRRGRVVTVDPTLSFVTRETGDRETKLLKIRISEPYCSLLVRSFADELKDACLIFVDNPNNPTGTLLLDRGSVDELCEIIDGVVLIDEAYYEFSRFTVADMVEEHANLVVVRTMSKAFGLAGLRVGYMIAGEDIAKKFSSQALPYLISKPSIYAATEALRNTAYVMENVRSVLDERERVKEEASKMGVKVYPSQANFLLMRTHEPSLARRLRDYGIVIADLSGQMPPGFARASIGTREENNALLQSLKTLFESDEDLPHLTQ
jgi:histidinol-phosphate aminotransferase